MKPCARLNSASLAGLFRVLGLCGAIIGLLAGCGGEVLSTDTSSEGHDSGNPTESLSESGRAQDARSEDVLLDFTAVSVIGRKLSRNRVLAGIVEANNTSVVGQSEDRLIDINEQQTTVSHLLGLLLADVYYTAGFEPTTTGNSRLSTLVIGQPDSASPVTDVATLHGWALNVPEFDEHYTNTLAERISEGEPEDVLVAIDQINITPGGVDLLSSLVSSETPIEIHLAAMERLDLADEYAAKAVVLDALSASNDKVVLAAISSIEVWRDATVLPYLKPLLSHSNSGIRRQAQVLVEDLGTHLVEPIIDEPESYDYSVEQGSFPDASELEAETSQMLPQP